MNELYTITCGKCGKTAPIDNWTNRPLSGELPAGTFQCPHCQWAFRRAGAGKWKFFRNARGNIVDGYQERMELQPAEARL